MQVASSGFPPPYPPPSSASSKYSAATISSSYMNNAQGQYGVSSGYRGARTEMWSSSTLTTHMLPQPVAQGERSATPRMVAQIHDRPVRINVPAP